jgi:hypothetical protein
VTETVNKSKLLKLKVDSNMIADYGRVIKLKNSPSHRWSAVEDVLVRLLRHWNAISNAFNEIRSEFPIKNDKRVLLELCSIVHPVRHVQTVAQKMKELVVFQVYLLMMQLYFGLLNKHNVLDFYDPSFTSTLIADGTSSTTSTGTTNPLDCLRPMTTVLAKDQQMTDVREKLNHALFDRYLKRYHPIKAYQKEAYKELQPAKDDFTFSYLLDIQQVFHPAMSDMKLRRKLIFSFTDATQQQKEKHYVGVTNYIWKTITYLAEQVAFDISSKTETEIQQSDEAQEVIVPQNKKPRINDPTRDLLNMLMESTEATEQSTEEATPHSKRLCPMMTSWYPMLKNNIGGQFTQCCSNKFYEWHAVTYPMLS